jgi:tetratricopeptide (TPR) repeat protein
MRTIPGFKKRLFYKKILFVIILSICLLHTNTASGIMRPAKSGSCQVFRAMARIYMADGNYSKAQSLAENALRLAEAEKSPESDSQRSICFIDLAYLYKNMGKFSDAQKFCLAGLELQKKIYYKDHPYIAGTLRILSSI